MNVSSGLLEKSNTGTKRENNRERKDKNNKRHKRRKQHIYIIRKEGKNPCMCIEMSIEKFRVDVKNIPTWNVDHV